MISRIRLKQLFRSRIFWITVAGIFAFGPVYERLPVRIDATMDRSLPYSVWITYADFNESKHRYALFVPPVHNRYTLHVKYLMKRIACYPGQTLRTKGPDYYCDGIFVGRAKKRDHEGRAVEAFEYNGTVPDGKYFMQGTHPRSYDSRYFGFVDRSLIKRGARPVW